MKEAMLYKQIEQEITHRIRTGVYRLDTAIPTELELCKEFNTSRLTVAKGLSSLIASGVIERIRGRGTFVRGHAVQDRNLNIVPAVRGGLFTFISALSDTRSMPSKPALLEGMAMAVEHQDCNVGVKFYDSVEEEIKVLQSFTNPVNAGFVIWSAMDERIIAILQNMRKENFPFVLVDAMFPQFPTDCISNDNAAGSELLVRHLYDLGHRRIAYLSVPLVRQSVCERMTGMLSALGTRDIFNPDYLGIVPVANKVNIEYFAAHNDNFIRNYLKKLLALSQVPTAIICSNDTLAVSVVNFLAEHNIAVPQQISVAGMDNTETALQSPVPLTSVAPDFRGIGERAIRLLIERSQNGMATEGCYQQYHLKPALVVRQSTAKVAD